MDTIDGIVSTVGLKEWFEVFTPNKHLFSAVVQLDGLPMNRAHIEDGFIILSHNPDLVKGTSGETLYRYLSYVLNVAGDANRNFPIFIETPLRNHDYPLGRVSLGPNADVILTSMGFDEKEEQ